MSEMAERLGKSMYIADRYKLVGVPDPDAVWQLAREADRERYRFLARAALEAMREPTDAMTIAGDRDTGTEVSEYMAGVMWRVMIAEALVD